jgi:hypothetical protein
MYRRSCNVLGHGAPSQTEQEGLLSRIRGDGPIPDYPTLEPAELGDGRQNYVYQDARIAIGAIVLNEPAFSIECDIPLVKLINQVWLGRRWRDGQWSSVMEQVGMDSFVFGVGIFRLFTNRDGYADIRRVSPLDFIRNPLSSNPKDWNYCFSRNRVEDHDAWQKYGNAFLERYGGDGDEDERRDRAYAEFSKLLVDANQDTMANPWNSYSSGDRVSVLHEWEYWDDKTHVVFLRTVTDDPANGHALKWNWELGAYEWIMDNDSSGVNPVGYMPYGFWLDSQVPGASRPTGKAEFMIPIADQLSKNDRYMVQIMDRAIPLRVVNASLLDPDTVAAIKSANSSDDIMKILVASGDASQAIRDIPAGEIPPGIFQHRGILRGELNTASGVQDAQRNQQLSGERTAYEFKGFMDASGVQAKHTLVNYATALVQLANLARAWGAVYEHGRSVFYIGKFAMDTQAFPLQPFLAAPLPVIIGEDSLIFTSAQEKRNNRLVQFQTVDLPAIQAGVADPQRVFADVYSVLGIADPYALMLTPEEVAAREQQQMLQMLMASQQEDPAAAGKPAKNAKPAAK